MKMRKFVLGVIAALGVAGVTWWQWPSVTDVQAVPSITGGPSVLNESQSFTITGSNFGTMNVSDIEWIGGVAGELESKAVGTQMRDFESPPRCRSGVGYTPCAAPNPPCSGVPQSTCMSDTTVTKNTWGEGISSDEFRAQISSTRAHSGSKSILSFVDSRIGTRTTQSGFDYKASHRFNEIYATWWTYFEPLGGNSGNNCNGPQWKVFRVNDGPDGERFNDTPGDIMLQENYLIVPQQPPACNSLPLGGRVSSRFMNVYGNKPTCYIGCPTGNCPPTNPPTCFVSPIPPCMTCVGNPLKDCYRVEGCCNCNDPYTPTTLSAPLGSSASNDANKWTRWEMYAHESDLDVKNGTFQWWLTPTGATKLLVEDLSPSAGTGVCTRRDVTGDPAPHNQQVLNWIWVCWHNYWGNANLALGFSAANMYIDDPYISMMNGKARIELGNASTYAACTALEMQKPTAWAAGSITATTNFGGIAPSSCWLYVTDSAGNTSAGWPVQLSCNSQTSPDRSGATSVVLDDSLTTAGTLTHEITSASAASGDTITVSLKLTGPYSVTGFRAGIYFEQNDFNNAVIEPVAFHGNLLGGTRVALTDPTAPARCVDDGCAMCPALELGGHHVRGVKWVQWAGSAVDVTAGVEVARIRFRAKNAGTSNIYWGCGNDVGQTEVQGYTGSNVRIFDTVGGGYTATGRGTFTQTTVGDITGLSPKFVQSVGTITVTGTWNPANLWPKGPGPDFKFSEYAVDLSADSIQVSPGIRLWGANLTGGVIQILYANKTFVSVDSVRAGWTVTAVDTVPNAACPDFNSTKKLKLQLCGPPENMNGTRICKLRFTGTGFMWIDCDEAIPVDTETCVQSVDPVQHALVWGDGTWLTVGEPGPWQSIPRLMNIRHEAGYRRFFNVDPD